MKVYDFGVGSPADKDDLFLNTLQSECKVRGLSFILVNATMRDEIAPEIKQGRMKIKFFLDLASETYSLEDKFTRFVYTLKDAGTRVVADPDQVRFAADKSITHFSLAKAAIAVPFSIIIRNWDPTRRLTDQEKESLGLPFVVKPALGYGQKGVKIFRERISLKEIAEVRKISPGDNFLLQEFIEPQDLDGSPAWFRIYYIFGEVIPCWWDPTTHVFRQVTPKEFELYKLIPLVRITSEIARITRIEWFSCEIAINKKNKEFVVIDYMNDQCAMDPQSKYKDGVPNDLIVLIGQRMIEKVWGYILGRYTLTHRAVWFSKIQVKDENV